MKHLRNYLHQPIVFLVSAMVLIIGATYASADEPGGGCGEVVVAGPWTFQPSGVEEVSFPVDTTELLGPCFIRLYNGAPDGSHRVFNAAVEFNGRPITDHMEISLMIGFFKEKITVTDNNTLTVQVSGTADRYLTIDIVTEYVAAGPWQIASQDLPHTEGFSFSVADPANPYRLCIINGLEDGSGRVMQGWVKLNGEYIANQMDFMQAIRLREWEVNLSEDNLLEIWCGDGPGSFMTIYLFGEDTTAPAIQITYPLEGSSNKTGFTDVRGTVDDAKAIVMVNNRPATLLDGTIFFVEDVPLELPGGTPTVITATATDWCGNSASASVTVRLVPLTIEIRSPQDGEAFMGRTVTVTGTVSRPQATVTVNDVDVEVDNEGDFTLENLPLGSGENTITATAMHLGEEVNEKVSVTGIPLTIGIESPADDATFTTQAITVTGTVSHPAASVTVNGQPAAVEGTTFTVPDISLIPGTGNPIIAEASVHGEQVSDLINVNYLTVTITDPVDGQQFSDEPITVKGSVSIAGGAVTVNAITATVDGNTFTAGGVPLTIDGDNPITAVAGHNGVSAQDGVVVVYDANDPPVAVGDSYDVLKDTTLNLPAPGVLGNDVDPNDDALSAILESAPTHGTVNLQADGSFFYTPAYDFEGTDSFTYRASDGKEESADVVVGIVVGTPDVDLEAVSLDASGTYVDPQTLEITGSVVVEIRNNGPADIPEEYLLVVFEDLNANQSYDGSEENIFETVLLSGGLAEGSSRIESVEVSGSVLFVGTLIYAVVDSDNAVLETNEHNNATNSMADCEVTPMVGQFNPEQECYWRVTSAMPKANRTSVVMAPVVANLTDDNGDGVTDGDDIPDIACITYDLLNDGAGARGTLRIFSGECAEKPEDHTHTSITVVDFDNTSGLAVGDLTNDGIPEIVAMTYGSSRQGSIAFQRVTDDGSQWEVLWQNYEYPTAGVHTRSGAHPAIADLNADGYAEVVIGNVALNGQTGALIWDGVVTTGGRGGIGNNGFFGPISSIADVDLDGNLEVAAGNTLYDYDGTELWTFDYGTRGESECGGGKGFCDGFTGIGQFDDDPFPEIVIVRLGQVFIIEHDGQLKQVINLPKLPDNDKNEGGPPTIADFDGDGRLEIGVAGADYYAAIDPDCLDSLEGCDSAGILWKVRITDSSSRTTGSSVFDFEGDGIAEVVYGDEQTFYIFYGPTGIDEDNKPLYADTSHWSHTRLEMPIVADVDNDGNAEIVTVVNRHHKYSKPGVRIYGDKNDTWVNTRKIWNQHAYSITNVEDDGTIPQYPINNWETFNNFRCNEAVNALACVDLTASYVRLDAIQYPDSIDVVVRIGNGGALVIGSHTLVSLYHGDPDYGGMQVQTLEIPERLNPGAYVDMRFTWPDAPGGVYDVYVVADDDGTGNGRTPGS